MTKYNYLFTLIFGCILCIAFSLLQSNALYISQLWNDNETRFIFWELRLPRTVTAFVSGGLLALAGSLMQLLLQNPLADPYALGISGGAAFFTILLMFCGFSAPFLIFGAWTGSLLTILLIVALAKQHRFKSYALLLCGIAIAYGYSAGISLILLLTPNMNLHSMLFWLAGDLNDAQFPAFGSIVLMLGFLLCMFCAPGLNVLIRGDVAAQTLGLDTQRYRIILFLLSSLFTATAVSMAGCIGFIGLLIPHLTRFFAGVDHRIVLPVTILLGGSLLTLADTLSQILFAPLQIPVGILTAAIGIPVYLWLLQK